ncbi:MAG: glycosyltransferase [Actinobacteria bacterium]|nr:glycosyltransferase [Actinomycetota bacterium]
MNVARASHIAVRPADLLLTIVATLVGLALLIARGVLRRGRPPRVEGPRLLAIDSIYSVHLLRARQAEHFVTHRDLDGYFEHVWSVHPLVGAHPGTPADALGGPPSITVLSATHTMIEGKTQRFSGLSRLPYFNFAIAQVQLVLMLDRIVHREGIGVVRGDPYYNGLIALLLGALHRRPVDVRVFGNQDLIYETVGALAYPRLFRLRSVEQRVARFTLSHADAVVVASADNRQFAVQNGARDDCLTFIANSNMVSPMHLAEPIMRERLPDEFGLGDRPVVMSVCRLEPLKRPDDIVRSVAAAQRHHSGIAAVIVGEGSMRGELTALCDELGVEDSVVLAGERDQRWIASMMTRADVIAVPLAGLALVEAALSGTPIVAYDVEWHSELIRPGREGLLVPYRDTDAMAAAIWELVADRERAAGLAAAARVRALEVMQPDKILADERALAAKLLAIAATPRGRGGQGAKS